MRPLIDTPHNKLFLPLSRTASMMSSTGPGGSCILFAVPDVSVNRHDGGVEWRVYQPWTRILIEPDPTYPELIRIHYTRAHTSATGGRPKYTPIGEAVYREEDIRPALKMLTEFIAHINHWESGFLAIKDTVELASTVAAAFLRELVDVPVHDDPLMQTTVKWVGDRVGGTSVHLRTPAGIIDVRLYTPDIVFDIFTEHKEKVKITVAPFAVEHRKVGKHKGRTTGQIAKFEIPTIIYLNMLSVVQREQATWSGSRDSVLYHAFRKCLRASLDPLQHMVQFPVHQLPNKDRSFRICVEGGLLALVVKIANLNERTVMQYHPKKEKELPC